MAMASATTAYRTDLAAHGQPFTARDGDWIVVASLVEQGQVESAWRHAAETLGDAELDRLARREWNDAWHDADAIVLLAATLHDQGARRLAGALLDALLRLSRGNEDLRFGRMLAQRARTAYQSGELEVAEDQYGQVDRLGRRLESPELRARAALGLLAVAHHRGNYPEHARQAKRAARFAEQAAFPRLQRQAYFALTLGASVAGDFDAALRHGWKLFELSQHDTVDRLSALQALGQVMLDMGDHRSARAAFAAVLSQPNPPKLLLATLGSFAVTAAYGDEGKPDYTALEWAVAEVVRLRDWVAPRFSYASSLLDCAIALRDAGRIDDARRVRDELLEIARTRGYHELAYRAESLDLAHPPAALSPPAGTRSPKIARIVTSVRRLEPPQLPEHVLLAAPADAL